MIRNKSIPNLKTKPKMQTTEVIDLDRNPFARKGSVSRSPPPPAWELEVSEASVAKTAGEERQARTRTTKVNPKESTEPRPACADGEFEYESVRNEHSESTESETI